MPDSLSEYLERDMACEGLLECIHGLSDLDRAVFGVLVEASAPLTVDDVADRVDRERSTAYRSIQRLQAAGFVEKEQVNYDHGGYYHVYRGAAPGDVADDMQALVDDWSAKMAELIDEFRGKYGERTAPPTSASQ